MSSVLKGDQNELYIEGDEGVEVLKVLKEKHPEQRGCAKQGEE